MKLSATVATILIVLAGVAMMTTSAEATVYEPSSSDARVVAALAAQKRLEQVMLGHDYKAIEGLMAPDLLVNAPINKVANRDNVIGRIKGSQISYEPNVVRNIDYAGVRGDIVVIMGEEIVHPGKDAPYAGKIEHRRFTDIWKEMDGAWKLWIRQATITRAD